MAEVIVIDFLSILPEAGTTGKKIIGTPSPGLGEYVNAAQAKGSSVFFIAGMAHDPFWRQKIERFLEGCGIRAVFVTHALPEAMTIFISSKAFFFNGTDFPPL